MPRRRKGQLPQPTNPAALLPAEAVRMLQTQREKAAAALETGSVAEDFYSTWMTTTDALLARAFGSPSDNLETFRNAGRSSLFSIPLDGPGPSEGELSRGRHTKLTKKVAVLNSCIEQLEMTLPTTARVATSGGTLSDLKLLLKRFHAVARQLRYRHADRTTLDVGDEYDVQDLLHSLLRIYFDDVRPEEWAPSYAAKSSRIDFILPGIDTVIEVKMTRAGLTAKELCDQLLIDIGRYQAHPVCGHLVCFVYDPDDRIQNSMGVQSDLTRDYGQPTVEVVIEPQR